MFYYIISRAMRETAELNDRKADIMRYINELHEGDRVSVMEKPSETNIGGLL